MVKKLFVCVLCLLLSGCTFIKENTSQVQGIPPSALSAGTLSAGRFLKANLYFLNGERKKLVTSLRIIALDKGQNPPEAVIKELINGPQPEDLQRVIPEGVTLDRVEASDDVAEVYMQNGNKKIGYEEMFVFKIAATNTLIDLLGVTYVNVFWDGVQKNANGLPVEPQTKTSETVEEAWNKEQEERAAQSGRAAYDGKVILYFAAKDGPFILPEIRNVSFNSDNSVAALIGELVKGPKDTVRKSTLFSKQTRFLDYDYKLENNIKTLILHFNNLENYSQTADEESQLRMVASLVYTLTGILTDIEAIKVDIKGKMVTQIGKKNFENGMQRSDFLEMPGKSIPLYMIYKDSTLLTCINRTVQQAGQWDPSNRLKELLAGPKAGDSETAWPVIPEGIHENDLLSVSVNADMIIVNCSEDFKKNCAGLSEEDEMLLIYGIVNTLTELKGIKQVLFQIEGKTVENLAGHLYLGSPFIKNPGIIKKTL